MVKIRYIFILFIFVSFTSHAEINDKGLICKCIKNSKVNCLEHKPYQGKSPYIGVFFSNNKVNVYSLFRSYSGGKSNLYISKDRGANFYLEPRYIEWPRPNGVTQNYSLEYFFDKGKTLLNRKTLMLSNTYIWGDFANNRTRTDKIIYDCNSTDLYKNPIIGIKMFKKEIDKFIQEGQKIVDEIKEENKF